MKVYAQVKGKIEFTDDYNKEFDREFTASLKEQDAAFNYGNGTFVIIEHGKTADGVKLPCTLIDTRYTAIEETHESFIQWITAYFKANYDDHALIIYEN